LWMQFIDTYITANWANGGDIGIGL
jgi:hypothetical protein